MLEPIVRLMVACEDARQRKGAPGKTDILGVLTVANVRGGEFPVSLSFCVYLVMTDARGRGFGHVEVADESTGHVVYVGDSHPFSFGDDPLTIVGAVIRVPSCVVPGPGLYQIRFVYNEVILREYPFIVRETS